MHFMLQVNITATEGMWSASHRNFQFRWYRIVLNFLLTDGHFHLEIMKSATPTWLIVGTIC